VTASSPKSAYRSGLNKPRFYGYRIGLECILPVPWESKQIGN